MKLGCLPATFFHAKIIGQWRSSIATRSCQNCRRDGFVSPPGSPPRSTTPPGSTRRAWKVGEVGNTEVYKIPIVVSNNI